MNSNFNNQSNGSFAMNQNHLHLHVNVTNSDFRYFDKSGKRSVLSDSDAFSMNQGSSNCLKSAKIKKVNKEKLMIKKNNVQYTPLTANGIFKNSSNKQIKNMKRIKTNSGDLSAMSLSNSSYLHKQLNQSSINANALSKNLITNILDSNNITQRKIKNSIGSSHLNKASISTKNLNMLEKKKNMRTSMSSLRKSISSFTGTHTYKQDAMKLLWRRINFKIKEYFDLLKSNNKSYKPQKRKNRETWERKSKKLAKCSRKSISSLKKAIGYCKEIETSFEKLNCNSPNSNRLKRSNDLRRSIQALGDQSKLNLK